MAKKENFSGVAQVGGNFDKNFNPLDSAYGPWDSFEQFVHTLKSDKLSGEKVNNFLKTIPPGLTVALYVRDADGNIIDVEEYWNPVFGEGFIRKSSKIEKEIEDLEYTVSEALIDLDKRVSDISSQSLETSNILMKGKDKSDKETEFIKVMGVNVA